MDDCTTASKSWQIAAFLYAFLCGDETFNSRKNLRNLTFSAKFVAEKI